MNLDEIERNVAELDVSKGFELIYDMLRAYGMPKASISRLKSGTNNRSKIDNECLWKGKVYYLFVQAEGADLHVLIDDAKTDDRITRERPRFLIVRDDKTLLAVDTRTETTLDAPLAELSSHAAFFMPWAGIEKTQLESLNYADVKAAERMARLYEEIIKHNQITTDTDVRHLNVFFSRLLFCFFAEDTGVFPPGSFTNSIGSLTLQTGEDTARLLDDLFAVLNTEESERNNAPAHFRAFGYVNGNLFDQQAPSPTFSSKARRIVLECGTLDWSQINPDIFGSMIQAVVHPGQRESLGMHYTSVENIMKVIRPLFLDELQEAFDAADSVNKLERLLDRIGAIKVFDPACGSGNFLVIAFKELRKLEHRIIQRIVKLQPHKASLFRESQIKLENFYGIEIDDFAHEIAILSLWLAKHQMNVEFHELFGVEISLIPLKDTGHIVCGNAAQLSWEQVCPSVGGDELYVLGNPPYLGGKLQNASHKADLAQHFGSTHYPRNLDYISLWFLKGSSFIAARGASLGFVSTNSVCQGDHVGLMWPRVFEQGVSISFAHESFLWSNQAKGKAGVTCIVVGLSANPPSMRKLFCNEQTRLVPNISPYLKPSATDTIVHSSSKPLNDLPQIQVGSRANDEGHLALSPAEMRDLVTSEPSSEKYVRRFMGAQEFINQIERYCLWIEDDEAASAIELDGIRIRLEAVRKSRGKAGISGRSVATTPHRFGHRAHKPTPSIIVPRVSSEHRNYIPMGFLDGGTVVSDLAYAIYDAEPWVFGVIQSQMHMTWVRAVSGRLKSDFRYSGKLVYNTFPVPDLTDKDKSTLTEHVFKVLEAREQFSSQTLAQLYDPDKMPAGLRAAHRQLDEVVDRLYRKRAFESDDERLELLFELYEQMTTAKDGLLTDA